MIPPHRTATVLSVLLVVGFVAVATDQLEPRGGDEVGFLLFTGVGAAIFGTIAGRGGRADRSC